MLWRQRWACIIGAGAAIVAWSGCGTPGAPQPPSLRLPDPVTDLSAIRTGDKVTLTWTMPEKTTDKLKIKDQVTVRVCRREDKGSCTGEGTLALPAGADGTWTETLPSSFASGNPRLVHYFVELENKKGRSAGLSNEAPALAGAAPSLVEGVTATVEKAGVVLRWTAVEGDTAIRLRRKLLTAPAAKPKESVTSPPPEPAEEDLLVEETGQGHALDKTVRFGEAYEYRAQRIVRMTFEGQTLELDGAFSQPVRVDVKDVFPPAVPTGLVAVAALGQNSGQTAIDLSWQPDAETDLAGYVVYRRKGDGAWERISPSEPVVGPAFHDPHVEPGHTYRYAVSAVDQGGRESARSEEAQETVPAQ
jgi:hypothetical protein